MAILERISEGDVIMWLASRLAKLRETTPEISHYSVGIDFRSYRDEQYYDAAWNGHAIDKCVVTRPSIESMHADLLSELQSDSKKRAEAARRKAAELLKEAEAIEALANQ